MKNTRVSEYLDPTAIYIQDLYNQDLPLLTQARETELGKRIRDHDDSEALDELVRHNLRLVVKIAKHYPLYGSQCTLLDLIQEGNKGLIRAAKTFDPDIARFSTHATTWIKQHIQRHLLQNQWVSRIPVKVGHLLIKMRRLRTEFHIVNHRYPGVKDYSRILHEPSLDTIRSCMRLLNQPLLLNKIIPETEDMTLLDILDETGLSPVSDVDPLEAQEQRIFIDYLLSLVSNEEDRLCIRLYYGLDGPSRTYKDISASYPGIGSREWVRLRIQRGLTEVRNGLGLGKDLDMDAFIDYVGEQL